MAAIGLSFFLLPFAAYWNSQAAGTYSGRVFQDYNGNATYDTAGSAALPAIDAGVAGVTVTLYDASGTARGSATTAANGTFSITSTGTGPYRVEFTTLPSSYLPSARSTDSVDGGSTANDAGSTVQFVANGGDTNINLALNVPDDYCQDNPLLCSSITRPGNQTGTRSTTFTIPYTSPTANTNRATTTQTGTVWGTAYQPTTGTVFQSAYMKRHAAFGSLGTGGIYRINPGTSTVGNYVDVQTIGLNTGTDPRVTAGYTLPATGATPHWDYAAYTEVGKRSIGDIDFDAGRNTLWFINLADRRLHGIQNVNPTVTPVNADLVRDSSSNLGFAVNTSPAITCTNGVLRPWGVKVYRGLVYVGAVCTGENVGATAANLVSYILRLDPSNPAAGFTQVVSLPLNYARNQIVFGSNTPWQPWRNSDSNRNVAGGSLPQPIVSDIEFDKDGSIIMGLRDRWGDQYAVQQYRPDTTQTNTTLATEIYGMGDTLRFCNSAGTFSNPGTAGCPNNARPTGETVSANQGPGSGEFYSGDWGPEGPDEFSDVTHGALTILPGSNRVVSTSHDPISFYSNGFLWLNNTNGSRISGYDVFIGTSLNSTNDFNKGNGMGDVELLCDRAPIEVGNRVWNDPNSNGVQDAGEANYNGVTLQLWADTNADLSVDTQVGTAVTDANGEYYFVGSTVADPNTTDNIGQINGGIISGRTYQVRIPSSNFNSGQPLNNRLRSPANNDATANGDSRDSDGLASSGNVIANFVAGGAGNNDHTFDFGFYLAPTAAVVPVGGRISASDGRGIRNVVVNIVLQNGTTVSARTGAFGYYRFDDVEIGQSVVVNVQAKRFTFNQSTVVVSVDNAIEDLDFVAIE